MLSSFKVHSSGQPIQQRPKNGKIAQTHPFFMSLVPDFALLQWFAKKLHLLFFYQQFLRPNQTYGGHFVFLQNSGFFTLAGCSSTAEGYQTLNMYENDH